MFIFLKHLKVGRKNMRSFYEKKFSNFYENGTKILVFEGTDLNIELFEYL